MKVDKLNNMNPTKNCSDNISLKITLFKGRV